MYPWLRVRLTKKPVVPVSPVVPVRGAEVSDITFGGQ